MKHINILLVNPWIYDFAAYDFWIKPIGLLSIGNILERHGYQTHLIDCLDRWHPFNPSLKNKKYGTGKFIRTEVEKPAILKHIPRRYCRYGMPLDVFEKSLAALPSPEVILVTSMMTYWYPGVRQAIRILKEKYPTIPLILGGVYATLNYDHALKNMGADYVISGAGEIAALQLVAKLTGQSCDTTSEVKAEFPHPSFRYYFRLASVPILTSTGCPYHCSFCASQLLSGKFRQRNPEEVIAEIEYLYRRRHVRQIAFYDDALLMNAERHLMPILEGVLRKRIHVNFHTPNGMHPKLMTRELAQLMFQTNFKTLRLSYESGSASRQADMGFKVTDDSLATAIDHLQAAGFRRHDLEVYVIMGLPDQTVAEVVHSMFNVAKLGARVKLTTFSPIPGTRDWKRAIESGLISPEIDPLLTNDSIFPLARPEFPYDMFQQIKSLSKVLNYGLDHGINFFDMSEFAHLVRQYIRR
ncbi:MAG: radical SAM protein [candidate division KSB1 bacterium]|nr:radical SAM protein [candidate division KSB1 bacterium]